MAKIILKEGYSFRKDKSGKVRIYNNKDGTYVRLKSPKMNKKQKYSEKHTRGMIGLLAAAWDTMEPCIQDTWGYRNVLFTVDGFDYFVKVNKHRLKEDLPLLLSADKEHTLDSHRKRPNPPKRLITKPGKEPGTIHCMCGTLKDSIIPVYYTQARGEWIKRGPLVRHEENGWETYIKGLLPKEWYYIYVLFIEQNKTEEILVSESLGVLVQSG